MPETGLPPDRGAPDRGTPVSGTPVSGTPVSERVISFRGREIATATLRDGQGYVSFNSLCDAFGLDRKGQRQRLTRQGSYYAPYTTTILMTTRGGRQASFCLQATAVPVFLAGVSLEHVRDPEAQELLRAFLEEVHGVLAEHFGISERGEIQFLQGSIARLVAEQEAFEQHLQKKVDQEVAELRRAHEEKVQQIREAFAGLRDDLRRVAQHSGPVARLTPEQRGQVRQRVATLGQLLIEKGVAKPYPGIYMDLTRLTGVARLEEIRQEEFGGVLEFLDGQIAAHLRAQKRAEASAQE